MRCFYYCLPAIGLGLVLAGCADKSDAPAQLASNTAKSGGYVSAHSEGATATTAPRASETADFAPSGGAAAAPAATASRAPADAGESRFRLPTSPPVASDEPSPPPQRKPQPQSGTLTAGSLDDHQRYDEFRQFVSAAQQNDPAQVLPYVPVEQRVLIHVRDGQGQPVYQARVVVRPKQDEPTPSGTAAEPAPALLDTTTASDGRVLFLPGLDAKSWQGPLVLTVYPPGGGAPLSSEVRLSEPLWNVEVSTANSALPKRLDLALVIDTTGSMDDELEYLQVEIDNIVQRVRKMFPNVEQRYALIVYRDQGDAYVVRSFPINSSLAEFRRNLGEQSAAGGGDYPEALHLALEQAQQLDWSSKDAARVMFIVADAPPHDECAAQAMRAVQGLRKQGVRIYPVAASGAAFKAEYFLRSSAFLTLGQYLFLTDHSGVGNPHAKPHAADYQVERLDALMIRMIASELSGKKLGPAEIIAYESNAAGGEPAVQQESLPEQSQQPPAAPPGTAPGVQGAVGRAILPPSWNSDWPATRWIVVAGAIVCVFVVDLFSRPRPRGV
jgi:hypothetical protein